MSESFDGAPPRTWAPQFKILLLLQVVVCINMATLISIHPGVLPPAAALTFSRVAFVVSVLSSTYVLALSWYLFVARKRGQKQQPIGKREAWALAPLTVVWVALFVIQWIRS
jgi:hypothetical protein